MDTNQAFDWIAFWGIAGTFLGGFFGSLITFKIQKYALEHGEKHRFQEKRLDVYSDFCEAATTSASSWLCAGNDIESAKKYLAALSVIQIIGSKDIRDLAGEFHVLFSEVSDLEKPIEINNPKIVAFNRMINEFKKLARKELRIEKA